MKPLDVGRVRVENVVEWYGPTRPTWVLPDASKEGVERHRDWLAPHFLDERGRLLMSIHSFIVQAPGLTVLVDTCVGNDKPRENPNWNMLRTDFLERLGAAGFPPESIDLVLCTHLHVDHIGWNTRLENGRWVPTFPRARYLFARKEWEHWSTRDGDEYGPIIADSVRPVVEAGRADLVEADHRINDELVLEPTPGHTPGHVSLRIRSEGREAVITGDLMHHPIQCGEPDWNSNFCDDQAMARATRRAFCARYADRDVTILGTHFGSPNAGRFVVSLFGVSVFGRTLVPVNFRLHPEEVRYIIEHSGSSVLLVDPELDEPLRHIPVKHRFVLGTATDPQLFRRTGAKPRLTVTDENATVSINYTSGTTARPKGVQLTHRNFWLNAATFGWHLALTDRDVYLHTLPTFHCNGWGMPYAVTGIGARHVVIRKIDGEEILRRVAAEGVTLLNCAPAVIAAVLDAAAARRQNGVEVPGKGRMRVVIAGAPPPSKTIERIETELGWEFIQIYGLTETSPLLTINRAPAEWDGLDPVERARRLSRAGVPAVGVRMTVDAEGEVLARSNHVFEGYWNQPEETAKAIVDGWFHTGDGGYPEAAYIAISDRKKDVIISGGENVSSIEVEDCLFQHAAVAEAAVIGVPDEKWGETIKALVVLRPGATATERDLMEHCRSRLAHFKCPTSVETRGALPRTATGKLQKFKLREPYWVGRARRVN